MPPSTINQHYLNMKFIPNSLKSIVLLLAFLFVCSLSSSARDLASCQRWGYAPNDYSQLSVIDFLSSPGDYGEGLKMPRSKDMVGKTIEGISLPVSLTSITDLQCFVATDKNFTKIVASVDVPDGALVQGFNDIAFDTPFVVPDKDLYVGYRFHQSTTGTALMVYNSKATDALFLSVMGSWMDYSPYGMGVSALQVLIGSDEAEDYSLSFQRIDWPNVLCGSSSLGAVVRSSSRMAVERFTYSITIGDETQTHEMVLDNPIPEGMDKELLVQLPFTAPTAPCRFDAALSITSVGEAPNAMSDKTLDVKLNAVSRQVTRRSVVEEYTGTRCGFCPKGWLGMETMKERYGDRFIGIAIHQYNVNDPMYVAEYEHLTFDGAPSCILDRNTTSIDPYKGSGYYTTVMGDFERANALLPDVEVTVSGYLDESCKSVVAESTIEFLGDADNYSVAYVLTADGLTGSTDVWAQTNYYYNMLPSAMVIPDFPELAQFCQGGELGQELIHLVYGDVMVASSWSSAGQPLTQSFPASVRAGQSLTDNYTLKLPTKSILQKAIGYDQLYVVALVLDDKGRVANAARARVVVPEGVKQVAAPTPGESTVYTIDGRKAASDALQQSARPGVYIVNGKKVVR